MVLSSCLKKLESEGCAAVSTTCGAIAGYLGNGDGGSGNILNENSEAFREPATPPASAEVRSPRPSMNELLQIRADATELLTQIQGDNELLTQTMGNGGTSDLIRTFMEVQENARRTAEALRLYAERKAQKLKERQEKPGSDEPPQSAAATTGRAPTTAPPTQSPGGVARRSLGEATPLRASIKLRSQRDYYQAGLRRQIAPLVGAPPVFTLGDFSSAVLQPLRTTEPRTYLHIDDLLECLYSGEIPLYEVHLTTFVKKGWPTKKGEIVAVAEATMQRGSWATTEDCSSDTYAMCTVYRDHDGLSTRCAPGFSMRKVAFGRSPFAAIAVGGYLVVLLIDTCQNTEFSFDHCGLVTDCWKCVDKFGQRVRGRTLRLFRDETFVYSIDEPPTSTARRPSGVPIPSTPPMKDSSVEETSKSDVFSSEGPAQNGAEPPRTLGELRPFKLVTGLGAGFIDARRCANCLSSLYGPLKLLSKPSADERSRKYTMPRLNDLAVSYAEMCAQYQGIAKATQESRAECEKTLREIFEILRKNKDIAAIPIEW